MSFDIAAECHYNLPFSTADAPTSVKLRSQSRSEGMSVSSKISLKKLGKCAEELMRPDPSSFSAFLRNAHPSDTAYWVASLIGAHESTVEAWIYQKALPQARHLGPLLAVYGPGVLAAIFPTGPQWIENAISAERAREVEAQLADLTAELESLKGAK